ncbi:MAG: hypothetical protein K2P78_07020 [Gemmataceae bacterium]|nr:hypothetical protein [Gemmataceae bacterium]
MTGLRVGTMTGKFNNEFGTYLAVAPGSNPAPGQDILSVVRLYKLDGSFVSDVLVDDLGFNGGVFVGGV